MHVTVNNYNPIGFSFWKERERELKCIQISVLIIIGLKINIEWAGDSKERLFIIIRMTCKQGTLAGPFLK